MGLRSSIKYVLLSSFRWPMNGQTQHTWHGRLVGDRRPGQSIPFVLYKFFTSIFVAFHTKILLILSSQPPPATAAQLLPNTHSRAMRGYDLRRTGRKKWPIRIMLSKQIAHSSRGTSSASQASKPAIQASNQQWYSETAARLHILNCAFH